MTPAARMRRWLVALAAGAVLAAGCSEDVEVSRDEAVEVLVLDGVPRDRAVCIVDGADGVVSNAKLTGIDSGITSDELADLAAISARCTVVDDTVSAVISGGEGGPDVAEGGGPGVDIDAEVERLISGGIAPRVAQCVGDALRAVTDPAAVSISETFLAEAIRICDR